MKFTDYKLGSYAKRHYRSLVPFLTVTRVFNVTQCLYEMRTRQTTCRSRPFVFRIEPCSVCNLRCPPCTSHTAVTKEKRVMELDDFKVIVGKIRKYALRASLYDMGEPLLNKDIYKMIGFASANKIGSLISTNFNLFGREQLDALFDSRLTVLEPCLDGFTQETYEKYRRNGQVDKVKDGIRLVMERKRDTKSKLPRVDVQVVLFDHVMNELDDIDAFLRQCHVDAITYRKENLGFNSPETTIKGKSGTRDSCYWLYLGMMIKPDGSVHPCCGRGFGHAAYGNLLKQELGEIWNNGAYRFSRSLFVDGPDLDYDAEMRDVPCLSCRNFKKKRTMRGC